MNAEDPRTPRWLDDAADPARRTLRQALDETERFAPSDLRARRVWARLADPARPGPARRGALALAFGLGAALACAAMALLLVRLRHQPVELARPAPPLAAPVGSGAPELLQAGPRDPLARTLPGGAALELAPGATVALAQERPEVRSGRVHFSVPRQQPGRRFAVRAAGYEVVVIGTAFFVDVAGASAVGVEVDHGVVEVWSTTVPRARLARLGAGERWHTPVAAPPAAEPAPAEETPGEAARAPEHTHARGPAAARASVALALAEARQARSRDPRRAAALLGRLAQGQGPVAQNALYELGGIFREELGQPRRALATWERYRARFPGGVLRAETDVSLIETLAALGERDRALGEATRFLDRHPHSEREGDIARVAGDLLRARGDFREALALYRRAGHAPASAANHDDARFYAATCLIELGDPGGAEALDAYLDQTAHGRHVAEARRLLEAAKAAAPK